CTYGNYVETQFGKEAVAGAIEVFDYNGKRYLTDYPENDINMYAAVDAANDAGCTMYVSAHVDWSDAPSGIMPLYCSDRGYNLGLSIWNAAHPSTPKREIKYQDDYEVTGTKMTAVIYEIGGIKADLDYLLANARLIGRYAAYGMMDYAGEPYTRLPDDYKPVPTPAPQPTNPYGFTSTYSSNYYLSYGDGPDPNIGQMQRDANFCGYRDENGNLLIVDNLFGSNCAYVTQCIERFHGLNVDSGEFGHDCDIALMCEVAQIQEALNRQGYNLTVDGVVGDATEAALADFQAKNGIAVDKCCGDATRAALGI
ncbi:MAG: peptidoglycan-binding protein, partial [Eubacterium sp.]